MSNEIKQGDKVRIANNAPRMYARGRMYALITHDCKVEAVEDDNAVISLGGDCFPIPTKYLVKVDAEAKEAKYKVGDRVRIIKQNHPQYGKTATVDTLVKGVYPEVLVNCGGNLISFDESDLALYTESAAPTIKVGDRVRNIESGLIGVVDKIVYGNIAWVNGVDGKRYHWKSDGLELIEPTEQTEVKENSNVGSITIPVEVDLTDSYWDAYAADLAKEVALKVANKFNDPEQAAEYAVSVAKAVVEGLKRK